jgi:hypothetical protein
MLAPQSPQRSGSHSLLAPTHGHILLLLHIPALHLQPVRGRSSRYDIITGGEEKIINEGVTIKITIEL